MGPSNRKNARLYISYKIYWIMHKESQIKTRTLYWSILPWNSLGRYAQKSNEACSRNREKMIVEEKSIRGGRGGWGWKSFDEDPIKITSSQEMSVERSITRRAKKRKTKGETKSCGYIKSSSFGRGKVSEEIQSGIKIFLNACDRRPRVDKLSQYLLRTITFAIWIDCKKVKAFYNKLSLLILQ